VKKNLPVQGYYKRAKVFGFMLIAILAILTAIYLYNWYNSWSDCLQI